MPVLESRASLSVRPIDSLTHDLFLRHHNNPGQGMCACAVTHTLKGTNSVMR